MQKRAIPSDLDRVEIDCRVNRTEFPLSERGVAAYREPMGDLRDTEPMQCVLYEGLQTFNPLSEHMAIRGEEVR